MSTMVQGVGTLFTYGSHFFPPLGAHHFFPPYEGVREFLPVVFFFLQYFSL